jgi:crotonobetaine/carnitine-CoA ligase
MPMMKTIDKAEGFVSLLKGQAAMRGEAVFGRFEGAELSFANIDRASNAFAAELRRRGLARGARVAVMLRNSPAAIAVIFGLAKAGAVWVPINVRQQGDGLRYVLDHSEPALLVVEADLADIARRSGTRDSDLLVSGEHRTLNDFLASGARFDEPPPEPHETFAIMYTSGTTGPPKGVMVTHAMLRFAAEAVRLVSGATDGDIFFVWEPFFHIGGAQILLLPLLLDVKLAMVKAFSASRFWTQVRAERATHIHYLGGVLQALMKQPASELDRNHGVRIAWGGGCPVETWRPFAERFGVAMRECYGMTETSSIATFNDGGLVGSVGCPAPWFDVAVVDDDAKPARTGETGTIAVREHIKGALFTGYFKAPHLRETLFRDGWFLTGDLGAFDDAGNLFFKGRATDSVRVKGENVSAWEVESVAGRHEAVEACAIIGVAADVGEQDIKLFVKPKPGRRIDPRELSQWLAQRLAPYQNPRYIAIVTDFERTPSERIMKHRLSKALDDCWDRLASAPA